MADLPAEIATTIQTASIKRNPSPEHDINPSTAASAKIPVQEETIPTVESGAPQVSSPTTASISSTEFRRREQQTLVPDTSEEQPVPPFILRPQQRHANLPPLPDLRFEQSYLASIPAGASWGRIAYITTRDQVLLPLVQGTLWTLALAGWRHWNRGARMAGNGVGARLRRWWWEVNNWEISVASEGTGERESQAARIKEFYQSQIGAGGD